MTIHTQTHVNQRAELTLLCYALMFSSDDGMLLVVLNATLEFFILQYLYILLNVFDNCKVVHVKQVALIPIRKSFWIFCTRFNKQCRQNWNLIEVLREVFASGRGLAPEEVGNHFDGICYLVNLFPVLGDTYKLEIAKMMAFK